MEVFIKDNLSIIYLKDKVSNSGLMEQHMMEVIGMESNMEEVYIVSQTVNNTMATGKMVKNMARALSNVVMEQNVEASGKTVREYNGLINKIES